MRYWTLVIAMSLLIAGADARERWGPPPLCPQPKEDCCPKKCEPKPCKPKRAPQLVKQKPVCQPKCDPCCKPNCPEVCFEQGGPTSSCCTPSAYSLPAAYQTSCGWNTFITASFIYWEAMQGGMELAVPGQATSINPLAGVTLSAFGKDVLYQDFQFKPGFQVGLGWAGGKDMWMLYAEYTWLHAATTTSASAPGVDASSVGGVFVGPFGVWIPTSWFAGGIYTNREGTEVHSRWDYDVDILDAQVSRPFYSGTNLVFDPFFGLRALWLDQELNFTLNAFPTAFITTPPAERSAQYRSNSWGLGPRAGINGKWMFGYGLRMIGDASFSLLYTRYTKVTQDEGSPDPESPPIRTEIDSFGCLRPNLDLSWGLAWGSYFKCRRFYWDLAATYDFKVFWEQNMMRHLANLLSNQEALVSAAAPNFYLQGLTLKMMFEF